MNDGPKNSEATPSRTIQKKDKSTPALEPAGGSLEEHKDVKYREPIGGFWIRRRTVSGGSNA